MDLIELDRGCSGLASTRSWFRALRSLLAHHGIALAKVGYTREMFEALCAGKLDPARFGDIRYEPIENRLMGLVPHEFKALLLRSPA
jgi:hypothetical protein